MAIGLGNFRTGQVQALTNYASDWQALYQENGWIQQDPVVAAGLRSTGLMHWSHAVSPKSQFTEAASDFGLRSGFVIASDVGGNRCIAGIST
ncbi:MAG: autoinducer binding domain-containing protein, partial [Leisingera sp.]